MELIYLSTMTVQGVMPRDAEFKQTLRADSHGFSLHAAVRCGADDRQSLEQLCRYIHARRWPTNAYKPTPLARSC